MAAVRDLCKTSLLLEKGRLVMQDQSAKVIDRYLQGLIDNNDGYSNTKEQEMPYIQSLATSSRETNTQQFKSSDNITIVIRSRHAKGEMDFSVGVAIRDKWGQKIFTTVKNFLAIGEAHIFRLTIPAYTFVDGVFYVDAALFVPNGQIYDYARECVTFFVNDYESELAIFGSADIGVVNIKCDWQ
jgi:hypothetical protein